MGCPSGGPDLALLPRPERLTERRRPRLAPLQDRPVTIALAVDGHLETTLRGRAGAVPFSSVQRCAVAAISHNRDSR